ncbi:cysteine-rich RLK (RECEPTOR-like protein kinase) 8 [Hibiscus trionum]|uniref:Cysteine-rich RLK (RECEPTOR-like protein kinase) 8 n=1 Tax=Hibiscus trionum TaxID=183268 RepID=A0A9W7H3B3_HIBTR|nr:cysteine-rich RLK (RECEPTOR-like protein kinase) 8 [Hibiscus trionum]
MQGVFEMSMIGELSFFLGLQIKQVKDGIFINQANYIKDMLKKFGLENVKPQASPMSSSIKLDKDEEGNCVDSKLYRSDADYGGCKIYRKRTSDTCNFLGSMLIS